MGGYMLYFIVNEKSKSGNAKQIWKEIEEVLKVRNVSYQAFVSEYRGHAGKLAAEICAMDDNDICLVAVGGDGTANEVINGITDFEKVRFGVIPTGSGNDLARGLSLSKDPKNGAIHILNAMKKSREDTWCMDLGEVNFGEKKRLFAISAGIGLDALVCKKALKSTIKDILNKIRLGKLTYLVLTVQSLFTMQTADAEIFFDRDAERIAFLFFKMFLFINCSCFLPSKGWMVLCRAVDTLFLYFGFSGCPFVSTDVGVSVADRDAPCVSSPRGLMSFFHVHFFYCCHT